MIILPAEYHIIPFGERLSGRGFACIRRAGDEIHVSQILPQDVVFDDHSFTLTSFVLAFP